MSVLSRDLTLLIVTGFHPTEANHTYYHALTQQWPTGSGAASTLLGSLCPRTFGAETTFVSRAVFFHLSVQFLSMLLRIFYSA